MPWCPVCKFEYRAGFSVCSDCGCDLVDSMAMDFSRGDRPFAAAYRYFAHFDISSDFWRFRYILNQNGVVYEYVELGSVFPETAGSPGGFPENGCDLYIEDGEYDFALGLLQKHGLHADCDIVETDGQRLILLTSEDDGLFSQRIESELRARGVSVVLQPSGRQNGSAKFRILVPESDIDKAEQLLFEMTGNQPL